MNTPLSSPHRRVPAERMDSARTTGKAYVNTIRRSPYPGAGYTHPSEGGLRNASALKPWTPAPRGFKSPTRYTHLRHGRRRDAEADAGVRPPFTVEVRSVHDATVDGEPAGIAVGRSRRARCLPLPTHRRRQRRRRRGRSGPAVAGLVRLPDVRGRELARRHAHRCAWFDRWRRMVRAPIPGLTMLGRAVRQGVTGFGGVKVPVPHAGCRSRGWRLDALYGGLCMTPAGDPSPGVGALPRRRS